MIDWKAFVLLIGIALSSQPGCVSLSSLMGRKYEPGFDTTMLKAQGYSIPPGGMPSKLPSSVVQDGTAVILEIRDDEPRMAAIPLPPDRAVTVEDLVRTSELSKSLGGYSLSIMRPNGDQPPVRLEVQLNRKGRVSSPSNNYALYPGDHIIAVSGGRN
jgi:hypothetical protein